jgi:hypothetical protein
VNNPPSKDIDIKTSVGLEQLRQKARYYGHYAEQLKVLELIDRVEDLTKRIENMTKLFRSP